MDSYEGSTVDPASLHKYAYCDADPVNRIDPNGQDSIGFVISVANLLVDLQLRFGAPRSPVSLGRVQSGTVLIFKTEGNWKNKADPWGVAAKYAEQDAKVRYSTTVSQLNVKTLNVNRVSQINTELKNTKSIVEIIIIGHAGESYVAVGAKSEPDTNISYRGGKNDVDPKQIDWSNINVLKKAPFQIQIWGCNTGQFADSIALSIANASKVPVRAGTGLMNFDENTGEPFFRWWRPGHWRIFNPGN